MPAVQLLRLTNPGRLQAFREKVSSTISAVTAGFVTDAANASQKGSVAPESSAMQELQQPWLGSRVSRDS